MTLSWLRTDEAEDVAGSIRHALRSMHSVAEDPQEWKWVVLALHSALQGACVCHLTTTATPFGALTPHNAAEWVTYLENRRADPNARPPRTQLMALPDLLKEIRKPRSAGDSSNDAGVGVSDIEVTSLRDFHEAIRNQFVHFEPMGWSLQVSGIPRIASLAARIIREIVDMAWAFRHKDSAWREALLNDLAQLALTDLIPK